MGESPITVAIRPRPLLLNEMLPEQPLSFHNGTFIEIPNSVLMYDFVFPPNTTNETVYNLAVANKIPNIFEGYNVTILAYGSTGSGKTYTMGTDYNLKSTSNSEMGIIPQGLTEIFRILESEKEEKSFSVKVSFVELYQEVIYDLCHPNAKDILKKDPKFLDKICPSIKENKEGTFVVSNLIEKPVNSIEEALAILIKGSSIRHTSATAKNAKSSRSHAIFTVYVEQVDKTTSARKCAKFQLVDLAGSERISSSKTQGIQAKEGRKINISLFSLSKVINALSKNYPHIPYRDSKLTRLLQDSLGGNSHTVMIACVNPSSTSKEEAMSTLRYASSARNIKNQPKVNVDPPAVQIEKLKLQVESLQAELYKMHPLSHLNKNGNSNSDEKALELLQTAYSNINTLNQKLTELEDRNSSVLEKLKSIYETIKIIVVEMMPVAAADTRLKTYLEKLEEIQSECYQLVIQENIINSMEDTQNSSETVEEYESCESVLPMDVDKEMSDSTDECLTLMKSEEEIIEELDEIAEKQKISAKRLEDVDMRLEIKQNIARCMQFLSVNFETASEEEKADTLVKKIQSLVKEKTDLETEMQKEKKCVEENKNKIVKYETDIKNLQDELRLVKKSLQMKDENKAKVQQLKKEMDELRRIKVKYMKEVKECVNANSRIQKQKNQAIMKLTREKNKKEIELSRMTIKATNHIRVLESRCNQATISRKALIQALQKQNPQPRQTGTKTKQTQLSLEKWLEDEIHIKVCNSNHKADVENLEKEADKLKEQIKEIEKLSPSVENKAQTNEIDDLRALLQVRLKHIDEMKNVHEEVNQKANSCAWLNELADISEAKPIIEYLFNKCVSTKVNTAKHQIISEENFQKQQEASEEKVKHLSAKIKDLEDQLTTLVREHEQNTANMLIKHEAELLQIRTDFQTVNCSSLSETAGQNRKRSLDTQDSEDLKDKYKKKCAEVDQLHEELFKIKKGKRSNWLSNLSTHPDKPSQEPSSQSMLAEYLSSEDEESFSNDPNDPDWRLTPLHKQMKRPRLETKYAALTTIQLVDSESNGQSMVSMDTTESESKSIIKPNLNLPCKCDGDCKTQRCRCQKRKVFCSEACSCSTDKCLNITDP